MDDLRDNPHNGYRAVHVIIGGSGAKLVEVQARTELQHVWAQLSEKLADRFGIDLKYGGGPAAVRAQLHRMSTWVRERDSEGATPFDHGLFADLANFMAEMQLPEEN